MKKLAKKVLVVIQGIIFCVSFIFFIGFVGSFENGAIEFFEFAKKELIVGVVFFLGVLLEKIIHYIEYLEFVEKHYKPQNGYKGWTNK